MLEEQAQQERSEPLWPKLQATTQGTRMHQLLLLYVYVIQVIVCLQGRH